MRKLADNLKISRHKAGLTQEQVANKLGLSIGTISGYERGYRKPDPDTLNNLADLYNVTTDYLLGREPRGQMMLQEARFPKALEILAEACANRTHQRQDHYRSTGFEVQAAHQDRSASV